jgi:hypothetical protein
MKGNIGESGGITTFPYFCAFLLKRFPETWQRFDYSERRSKAKEEQGGRDPKHADRIAPTHKSCLAVNKEKGCNCRG